MSGLLLDQNLSFRIVAMLEPYFPGTTHVRHCNLDRAGDREVWDYAKDHDLAIVSKDGDFRHLALTLGAPPKVVWVRAGNASTDKIASILAEYADEISRFLGHPSDVMLVLGP